MCKVSQSSVYRGCSDQPTSTGASLELVVNCVIIYCEKLYFSLVVHYNYVSILHHF